MAANQVVRYRPPKKRRVLKKQDDLITIGFQVKQKEEAIIQDYVNRMYNQFVVDPNTKQPKRMLDCPSREFVTKLVTFSYMTQFNWFMQQGNVRRILQGEPRS